MTPRPVRWVASSRDDLRAFPTRVREVTGTALFFAQTGGKHPNAKPLKGIIGGSGVVEVVADDTGSTYRTVYTVTFPKAIYVLHAFQKKSRRGIATPGHEIELIRSRYEQARLDYEREFGSGKER